MRTCQREFRRAVVKRRRLPGRRCMAQNTILRKTTCLMVGIRRRREICAMAIHAIRRQCSKLVVGVALITCYCTVRTRQWKFRVVMSEG